MSKKASQTVFSNENEQKQNNNNEELDSNLVSNLSAIDMRIYDLEKDVNQPKIIKTLTDFYKKDNFVKILKNAIEN